MHLASGQVAQQLSLTQNALREIGQWNTNTLNGIGHNGTQPLSHSSRVPLRDGQLTAPPIHSVMHPDHCCRKQKRPLNPINAVAGFFSELECLRFSFDLPDNLFLLWVQRNEQGFFST